MNLYSWLQGHAKERPGKVAIRFRDQEITFRELYRLTDALGTALRGAGVNRDDHVTLMLPNVPEFVLTYMATIGIGAGPDCDGQVLVTPDMLGLIPDFNPRFVKKYAQLADSVKQAVAQYADEVSAGQFPADEHSHK